MLCGALSATVAGRAVRTPHPQSGRGGFAAGRGAFADLFAMPEHARPDA